MNHQPPRARTLNRPSRLDLEAARDKMVPDLIAAKLKVLFCGINPSLYSAAVGHHFARPGNRFWPTLAAAGFTERVLLPSEEAELLARGYGISNLVDRATAAAAELTAKELHDGAQKLANKAQHYRPKLIAFLGIEAYRKAFARKDASLGPQDETLGTTRVWVLPNPSGLNAHYQLADLAKLYAALRRAV